MVLRYLVEPWCNWYVSASGVPAVKPNQNPQERAHGVMKSTANGKLHSSTEYCVNNTIPEMMANFRDATNHSYVAEDGPLPNDMIVKAYMRESSRFNQLQKVNDVINNTGYGGYVVKPSRSAENSLTKVMGNNYIHLMEGNARRRNLPTYQSFLWKQHINVIMLKLMRKKKSRGGSVIKLLTQNKK